MNPESERSYKIDRYTLNRAERRGEPERFPFGETAGNYDIRAIRDMTVRFLKENQQKIDGLGERVIQALLTHNADLLTRGRQTWCPIRKISLPAAAAYNNLIRQFKRAGISDVHSCVDFIQAIFTLMGKQEMVVFAPRYEMSKSIRYDRRLKMRVPHWTRKKTWEKKTLKGEKVRKRVMNWFRSFCSYIKHGERGKLERRAIASANPMLRMFLYWIEEFHLALSKLLPGSTISIGGDEKKQKILSTLLTPSILYYVTTMKFLCTQDATKFNECRSADLFGVFHDILFDPVIREKLELPKPKYLRTAQRLVLTGNFLLAIKRVWLGETPQMKNDFGHHRLPWKSVSSENFSEWNREAIEAVQRRQPLKDYLEASPGMLMGMHNALSTTIGLATVGLGVDPNKEGYVSLRSSDDSMTLYITAENYDPAILFEKDRRNLKMVGINYSLSNNILMDPDIGEYKAMFIDGKFVAQYGTETAAMRPQGKNPADKFFGMAKTTSVAQQRLEVNPFGARVCLTVGVDNVRRLWRIDYNPHKRPGINPFVLMLSDGGGNIWSPM